MNIRPYILPVAAISLGFGWAAAPTVTVRQQDDWCRDNYRGDRGWFCEVREFSMNPGDLRRIDASPNGGISVTGWDRNEVYVVAKVQANAYDDADAEEMVSEVEINTSGRTLEADGPRTGRNESWSVSYRISVPYNFDLDMNSTNGGITIESVTGNLDFHTTNGGATLIDVGGDVRGRTTNGGLKIELAGSEWDGPGLDVQTTNGGVRLLIPDDYNANLISGTTNGGIRVNFPITVSGRIDRRINAELGRGGATIKVTTTNGGVTIDRR
ncbi:MAG: DUF4097 family beta strand repeat protein [Gemmatimonadota bacterium]|nr:MAG: DUF4097 family beta strand repeat protein [Gemmatimonadota bacterium]